MTDARRILRSSEAATRTLSARIAAAPDVLARSIAEVPCEVLRPEGLVDRLPRTVDEGTPIVRAVKP